MLTLLKNVEVYSPEYEGIKDIFIANGKIENISESIDVSGAEVTVIDCTGKIALPGFIDQHEHIIGGGGEAGPHSRTPEVMLSNLTRNGITTVIGVLGTDGTTRHVESLLTKARGLETEGVSTYILTGSYEIPIKTITTDIRSDIILIDKVLGVGEVALSDHRSSQPTIDELKKIATQARLGGMLSGKAGVFQLHMGDGKVGLNPIFDIIESTEIPARHFIPTHINRQRSLFEQAIELAKMGAFVDLTSGIAPQDPSSSSIKPSNAMIEYLEKGGPLDNLTMSSDGNGSMPSFDSKGNLIGLHAATAESLYTEFKDVVFINKLSIDKAIRIISTNPAKANGLYPKKGALQIGSDADVVITDKELNIDTVFAKGAIMVQDGDIKVFGTFEKL